jgi:class 3 adenylate cyclase/tetratricopeptide (TPR) repeat protein
MDSFQSGVQRAARGERRLITALFADVVGSTAMAEELDPEQISEIMNGAFSLFNPIVAKYGGTVTRLLGDAVLALFGVPAAHEDDAERAVCAGLEIRDVAHGYSRTIQQQYGVEFGVRIGVNTGLAVVDFLGDGLHSEYTALGDAVNTAARMQGAAHPGTVLITADTHRQVRNLFVFERRGSVDLKGKSEPVEAYEVLMVAPVRGKVRGIDGLSSPLVGRDDAFGRLREVLSNTRHGRGAFVAIVGEAGLGKSRLVAELRRSVAGGPGFPAMWIEGRAQSFGQSTPYDPWRQVLMSSIGAREGDAPGAIREQLRATGARLHITTEAEAILETLLGIESAATAIAPRPRDGKSLSEQIAVAVRSYLAGLAQQSPTVLVFDDLHWADAASSDLLEQVSVLVENAPVVIIAALRPDKQAASWAAVERVRGALERHFSEIVLDPLSTDDSRHLLGNLLRIEDLPESVRTLILAKSDGNPFFIEEVIRTLIDGGYVIQENGHWRATRGVVDVPIPETLSGLLSARIDRLPADTKRVGQTAAVVGRIFGYRVLAAACAGAPPGERIDDVSPHLGNLTGEELIRQRVSAPEVEYIFKHALTQEAAYSLLLLRHRRECHRRVGQVIETLNPERLDELAPVLAHHFWQGEDWERAATYATRAGERAVKLHALREAVDHYRRAVEALDKLPDTPPQRLIDALLAWTVVAFQLRRYDELVERLPRAVELARASDDKRRLAQVLVWLANAHVSSGFPSRAMEALVESHRLAADLGDQQLSILPQFIMTLTLVERDPRDALTQLDAVIDLARRYQNQQIEAHALATKAMALSRMGEFDAARDYIASALEIAPRVNAPITVADVNTLVALAYFDMGEVERGLEHSHRATEITWSASAMECHVYGLFCTGLGRLQKGDLRDALEAFQQGTNLTALSGASDVNNRVRAGLAIAQFAGGRVEALADMEDTLVAARQIGDEYMEAFIAHALGEAHARLEDFERAEGYFQTALDYYARTDQRPYLARSLEALAAMYEQQGRQADASRTRAEARTMANSPSMPLSSAPAA